MSGKSKVIGENLVIVPFSEILETRQTYEMIGGPGTTRTCDPLLRRPKLTLFEGFCKCMKPLSTPRLARVSEEKRPLADSHQKQRFREVSGEQLVNFSISSRRPARSEISSIIHQSAFFITSFSDWRGSHGSQKIH